MLVCTFAEVEDDMSRSAEYDRWLWQCAKDHGEVIGRRRPFPYPLSLSDLHTRMSRQGMNTHGIEDVCEEPRAID